MLDGYKQVDEVAELQVKVELSHLNKANLKTTNSGHPSVEGIPLKMAASLTSFDDSLLNGKHSHFRLSVWWDLTLEAQLKTAVVKKSINHNKGQKSGVDTKKFSTKMHN